MSSKLSPLALLLLVLSVPLLMGAAAAEEPAASSGFMDMLAHQPLFVLFGVLLVGLLLGKVEIAKMSLGSSGVLFAALIAGHFGLPLPPSVGNLGLVLFVYCVGLAAGPKFFVMFRQQGKQFAILSTIIVALGALAAYGGAFLFGIPADLTSGLFAGALTSTPALAAAVNTAGHDSSVAVGFGIAYPFGVVGVVMLVQLLPRLLGQDVSTIHDDETGASGKRHINRMLVEIVNPVIVGRAPRDIPFIQNSNAAITRLLVDERLVPIDPDYVFQQGDHVVVVAENGIAASVTDLLGRRSDRKFIMDAEFERQLVVVTAKSMLGRPLGEVKLLGQHGVVISRVTRQDVSFVPTAATVLQPADTLTVVGRQENVESFAKAAGHSPRALEITDIASMSFGIIIGILVGMIDIPLPTGGTLSLGLAGGPLMVALLLGHFGKLGPVRGYMPPPSRHLLTDIGLMFFLASAGVKAGGTFVEVLQQHGVSLFLAGMGATLLPMIAAYPIARYFLKLDLLSTLGGICGGMTSTPGLGAITAKTEAQSPVVGYAAAYPVALIFMTFAAQLVFKLVGLM